MQMLNKTMQRALCFIVIFVCHMRLRLSSNFRGGGGASPYSSGLAYFPQLWTLAATRNQTYDKDASSSRLQRGIPFPRY